ncbi:MAG: hypothetical protein GWP06_17765 [Actinobacteria bacterium]|nr:hypothetical protein [Actinomycetota bacterium]
MKQKKENAEEKRQATIETLWDAAALWPGEFLTREDAVSFSGNALSVGHLANLDCKGKGPDGAFYLGRKRIYSKKSFIEFLIRRLEV